MKRVTSVVGVYKLIDQVMKQHKDPDTDPGYLQIEQDLLMKYCGDGKVYVFETRDFWMQVKSAG
jgi:NDP-sugar pyrophosphorylase family protein